MRRLAFRADASTQNGFGHASRCVALATAVRRHGNEAVLVASRPEADVVAFAGRSRIPIVAIDADAGSERDADATREIVGADGWVVVDGYAFGSDYLRRLGRGAARVAYIDDLTAHSIDCDVVINANVCGNAESYDKLVPSTSVVLAGPAYAIVHDRFLDARRIAAERVVVDRATRVLVTMGASDPPGATLDVIDALRSSNELRSLEIRIVVGGANRRAHEIAEAASASARHRFVIRTGVEDMAAEMLWSDVVITASGVTATEVSCVGIPGITFAIASNQEAIAVELGRRGMFDALPSCASVPADLARVLARLLADGPRRAAMIEAQRGAIDGEGKERILARLLALGGDEIHTRAPPGGIRG